MYTICCIGNEVRAPYMLVCIDDDGQHAMFLENNHATYVVYVRSVTSKPFVSLYMCIIDIYAF
jgi:hypothetical protein